MGTIQAPYIHPATVRRDSDKRVCDIAIEQTEPKWVNLPYFQKWVTEANHRGFSEQKCATMTGRFGIVAEKSTPEKIIPPSRQEPTPTVIAKIKPKNHDTPRRFPLVLTADAVEWSAFYAFNSFFNCSVITPCSRVT